MRLPATRVVTLLTGLTLASCADARRDDVTVEVLRVAPPQLVDSLQVTPALDTAQNTPEQGDVALRIALNVRNASDSTRPVPRIGFRAVPESGADTAARWHFDITRREVDSLRAGEAADFGITTSPATVAGALPADGIYRVEAVLDGARARHTMPVGRIRLRAATDST